MACLSLQVCVDMGEPILKAADVPTTLQPTQVWAGGGRACRVPVTGRPVLVACHPSAWQACSTGRLFLSSAS